MAGFLYQKHASELENTPYATLRAPIQAANVVRTLLAEAKTLSPTPP